MFWTRANILNGLSKHNAKRSILIITHGHRRDLGQWKRVLGELIPAKYFNGLTLQSYMSRYGKIIYSELNILTCCQFFFPLQNISSTAILKTLPFMVLRGRKIQN